MDKESIDIRDITPQMVEKMNSSRGYFRSVWTVVYQFWAHLIWAPKLGKPRKKTSVKVNIDISCKYFSFLVYQRSAQLLHKMLDTLIEALTAFTVTQS